MVTGSAWIAHRCNGLDGRRRRPTHDERTAYNGQAAGPTARLTCVRYPGRSGRHGSFTSARHGRRRRMCLQPSIQAHVLEDACNHSWIGNGANHLQLSATMGTPAQINSEYPLQSRHPTHWRSARIGLYRLRARDQAEVIQKPRRLCDNGSSGVSNEFAEWPSDNEIRRCAAPSADARQGKASSSVGTKHGRTQSC
jgi:hypothetical protein